MNCILAVRSEIKIRGYAAAHVQTIGQAMDKESEGIAYLR
jgi:hypothetical protein